jgi:hypothetical protein
MKSYELNAIKQLRDSRLASPNIYPVSVQLLILQKAFESRKLKNRHNRHRTNTQILAPLIITKL